MAMLVQEPLASWGNEYVRNLAGEIGQEFQDRREADQPTADLLDLVAQIVPYHMSHNAGGCMPMQADNDQLTAAERECC